MLPDEQDLGYYRQYDYTQYSHDKNVNVIPQQDFQRLVMDTFSTIAENLRMTYGPYASQILFFDSSGQTCTTKDGYNTFCELGFSHQYQALVYRTIKKIIDRVNRNVGDGTTSCILLAEKMFSELKPLIETPEHARKLLAELTKLEESLQNRAQVLEDKENGLIGPLTKDSMNGLVSMAGNYDDELSNILINAMKPTYDGDVIKAINNVEVTANVNDESMNIQRYTLSDLPGDYRISVEMTKTVHAEFFEEGPKKVHVALYDHEFNDSDWNMLFTEDFKQTHPYVLVLTRNVNTGFMDNTYLKYCNMLTQLKHGITIIFARVHADYVRDTLEDLAHVLGTDLIGNKTEPVKWQELPETNVQLVNGWIMCFDKLADPTMHKELLKKEMEDSPSQSIARHKAYTDRIYALENLGPSSLVTLTTPSSLESKVISDKIDDCLAIVRSACDYGIVPNLLTYGYNRIKRNKDDASDELIDGICDAIMRSITGLFTDVWTSKHLDSFEEKRNQISTQLYGQQEESFDILGERFIPREELPTSAQYDLEVISAAISIVKYLLTSKAMIFTSAMMKPVTDSGRYVPYPMQ